MGGVAGKPDNATPDQVNSELIDAYYEIPLDYRSIRIGSGETVGDAYSRAFARLYFLKALYRLAPETSTTLGTADARAAARVESEIWGTLGPEIEAASNAVREAKDLLEVGPIKTPLRESMERAIQSIDKWMHTPEAEALKTAAGFLSQHVNAWQERWSLEDDWIADAAYMTLMVFQAYAAAGYWFEGPLVLDVKSLYTSTHDGKELKVSYDDRALDVKDQEVAAKTLFRFTPNHKLIEVPIHLDHLKHPPRVVDDGECEDDGWFGTFDPRTESIEAATTRLLESIRPRLHRALEAIAAEDRELNGALAPVQFRSPVAFEWLVQFQVLGQSRGDIARELAGARRRGDPNWTGGEDHYKSNVGKRIREAAELVGLTLRDA